MKELKELLNELKLAIIASETADKEYEKNPESQEAETAFDKAYKHEYSIREKIAHKIVEVTSGAVEYKIALKMTYNPDFHSLMKLDIVG